MRLQGPPLQPPRFDTLNQALRHAAGTPHGLVLVDGRGQDTPLSYQEVHRAAGRVAASLVQHGLRPRQRVVVALSTGPEFMFTFFGALLAGAVPVPVAPPSGLCRTGERLRTLGGMVLAVDAAVVVTTAALLPQLAQAAQGSGCTPWCVTAAELLQGPGQAEIDGTASSLGLIQFSSGSTAQPKPVALTHASLLAQLAALEQLMGTGGVGVCWLPMHHDMGLIGCLLSAVYQARPLALLSPETFLTRPVSWLRAISRHRATASPAPNFAFRQCLTRVRDVDLEGLDLSSWRFALNGAEALSSTLITQFTERFARVGFQARAMTPAYGLAESSLAVTTTIGLPLQVLQVDAVTLANTGQVAPPDTRTRELVSVGRAVPGARVEVRLADGSPAADGRVGRIFTQSPSVMSGYFADPAATEVALRDGWLDTGDLGFTWRGELYISGRAKDIVIIRGANHSPQEFEDCLADVEGLRTGVSAVAAGFVPAGADDEELLILVEWRAGSPPDLARRITTALLDHTGIKPHTVAVVEQGALPRTTSGKLRRAEAVRRYLAGELRPAATAAPDAPALAGS